MPKAGGGSLSAPATAIKLSLQPTRCLRQRSEYRQVYEHGTRRHSPHFVLFALHQGSRQGSAAPPETSAESRPSPVAPSRFGITVSRKLGRATVRNRIRRRTREVLRRHLRELGTGWDVVINPRRSVLDADFAILERELIAQVRLIHSASTSRRP